MLFFLELLLASGHFVATFRPLSGRKFELLMAEDKEVLREIWEGKIPVTFTLEPSEISTNQRPTSFYVSVIGHTFVAIDVVAIN